jgi:hypothetical protein
MKKRAGRHTFSLGRTRRYGPCDPPRRRRSAASSRYDTSLTDGGKWIQFLFFVGAENGKRTEFHQVVLGKILEVRRLDPGEVFWLVRQSQSAANLYECRRRLSFRIPAQRHTTDLEK